MKPQRRSYIRHMLGSKTNRLSDENGRLRKEIVELKCEIKHLESSSNFERNKIRRLQYLVNRFGGCSYDIKVDQTSKGVNVLVVVNPEEFEAQVFDLDSREYNQPRVLVLWATRTIDHSVFIDDIQGGSSRGHGTLAMERLLSSATQWGSTRVFGRLSPVDFNHIDRLVAFYKKFEFDIDLENRTVQKSIGKRFARMPYTKSTAL